MGRPSRQAAVAASVKTAAQVESDSDDDFEEPPPKRQTPKRQSAGRAQKSVLAMLLEQDAGVPGGGALVHPVAEGCVGWLLRAQGDDKAWKEGRVRKYDDKKKLHLVAFLEGAEEGGAAHEEWVDLKKAKVEWKELKPEGEEAIGRRVGVWWGGDDVFYYGEVTEWRASDAHHLVRYDDDEEDWLDLAGEKTTWDCPEEGEEEEEEKESPPPATKNKKAPAKAAPKKASRKKASSDSEDFSAGEEEASEEESSEEEASDDESDEDDSPAKRGKAKPKASAASSRPAGTGAGKKQSRPDTKEEKAERAREAPYKPSNKKRSSEAARERAAKLKAPKKEEVNPADLPVINEPINMFKDLVGKTNEDLAAFAKKLNRPLRVATMCSGTESPLLALDMICRNLEEQHGVKLEVEHVFSCEIEPFKQAYIERNFAPPLLFRDIRELGGEQATTAYGALADVPGGVDMLVAGTSCVDYSNLNTQKKDLDDKGESGQTFRGMMKWIDKHKPPLIILENVCSAPWPRVADAFEDHGYKADFMRVDTKNYYIPHTRTRVYLMASLHKDPQVPGKWYDMVQSLERPASSVLEAFLLPTDDPRVHNAREALARPNASRNATGVDWNRCESRHQRARLEESLGSKRPFTSWEEGAQCRLPDYAWNDWATSQTDRVLDLMDINALRLACKGVDPTYKTLVWNLSQNVDRETGSSRPGICPCLTPSMVPFVTNRGGPLVGIEALSLQGIPVNDLLLTRESEDNMADLAGNAMTTTVVGACMIAAICVAGDVVTGEADVSKNAKASEEGGAGAAGAAQDDVVVVGSEALKERPLALQGEDAASVKLDALVRDAQRSARLCFCEGQQSMASAIRVCSECGHTACTKCGARPEHAYEDTEDARLAPHAFAPKLKAALPMWVQMRGLAPAALEKLKPKGVDAKLWLAWVARVAALEGGDFCFRGLNRAAVWTASYAAPGATLDLVLDPACPTWLVSVEPPAEAGPLRNMLTAPVARMKVGGGAGRGLLGGQWELKLPVDHAFKATVVGRGDTVDTWEGALGLKREFENGKRFAQWEVSVPKADAEVLDDDISGVYRLLDKCGAAQSSLHRSDEGGATGKRARPLYLFLDPLRAAKPDEDFFVFAHNHRRLAFTEKRGWVARLATTWRPTAKAGEAEVECFAEGRWVPAPDTALSASAAEGALVAEPPKSISLAVAPDACCEAVAVLRCCVPLIMGGEEGVDSKVWPEGRWARVKLDRSKATFDRLAWFTERVQLPAGLATWAPAELSEGHACGAGTCRRCAPPLPELQWVKTNSGKGGKVEPRENVKQAAEYEQALKRRPKPFIVELRADEGAGTMRVSVNAASLMHRALSALVPGESPAQVSWRVVEHREAGHVSTFPHLKLISNRHDKSHPQPPHFKKHPLRPEQLRSLGWMLAQEASSVPFVEEEVTEAVLPGLKWRAEGRAEREVVIRGGVLADQVGYGKTAITLALVDMAPPIAPPSGPALAGRIPVKATLVLAPPHLLKQWPHEVTKFCGSALKVVVVNTAADINRLTVKQVQEADVIVAATSVLRSDIYFDRLAQLAGSSKLAQCKNGGRHFNATYAEAMRRLEARLGDLTTHKDGAQRMAEAIRTGEHAVEEGAGRAGPQQDVDLVVTKRLKGKALIAATEKAERLAAAKAKKAAAKAAKAAKGEEDLDPYSDDEEMDAVEEEEEEAPAPKKGKGGSDVWNFKSKAVQKDWRAMSAPPFEIFHFQRVVVDEFTYLQGRDKTAVLGIRGSSRWCLSGTPPVESFKDVKGVAAFLGANLGVDEVPVINKRDQTKAEVFQFYREIHTNAWHQRRHQLAQNFLDRFVRQNIAEIDEILAEQHLESVNLLPAERAIYLELEHHLQAMDMKAKKKTRKGAGGDREARLRQVLGASGSAEEALLKRCAHFDIAGSSNSALQTCQDIVDLRQGQLDECREDVVASVAQAHSMLSAIRKKEAGYDPKGTEDPFLRWTRDVKSGAEGNDDADAWEMLKGLLEEGAAPPRKMGGEGADGKKMGADDMKWELREHTHLLRRLQKELVGRVRSLRYFQAVRDLQKEKIDTTCPGCKSEKVGLDSHAVLSCCGHTGCKACLYEYADKQECPYPGCGAAARASSVILSTALGRDSARFGGGKYGSKLLDIIATIQSVPEGDRVLLFVQFADLMSIVAAALEDAGIKCLQLKGSVFGKTTALEEMQREDCDRKKGDARVLMLNIKDESASGANLTTANHCIFVHPLLAASQQEYSACETQAFGRVRRYGQTKKVHLYRFLVSDTIDTEIHKDRVQGSKDDLIPVVVSARAAAKGAADGLAPGGVEISPGKENGEGANGVAKSTPRKRKAEADEPKAEEAEEAATPSKGRGGSSKASTPAADKKRKAAAAETPPSATRARRGVA